MSDKVIDITARLPHRVSLATCRECGNVHVAVILASAPRGGLECNACGRFACAESDPSTNYEGEE